MLELYDKQSVLISVSFCYNGCVLLRIPKSLEHHYSPFFVRNSRSFRKVGNYSMELITFTFRI